ncbi:hypothetical protein [uncultured Deinococcus sp.]|uniref:TolB family protein n=1 Tax=uncultured Deinococcus sp. TaxID=158789 RepID=UPI0025E4560D|nr:hypothetical protein [uncultured Deinococcus sp.]
MRLSIPTRALTLALVLTSAVQAQCVCAPALFLPSVVSGPDEEFRVTFTPDGKTMYFARSAKGAWFPQSRKATIYQSTLQGGYWTVPVVAPFSGTHSDIDPFVSPDGQRLYFSSIRPVNGQTRQDADLWMVERRGDGWSEPVHLGDTVNSPRDDLYPSVDRQGTLYFGSEREFDASGWDIYTAKPVGRSYSAATKLPAPVNSSGWDFNPAVTADGQSLYFTGLNLPGGAGLGDLYVSTLQDGKWSAPRNLGAPFNTASDEFHPSLSPDGKTLYFIRRVPVEGDLYSAPLPSWLP